jgi:AbrB family looped-hinge helix DNA binding protein
MELIMKQVTVSSKFQVVIPREVRESMNIQPGTRVQVLQYENRIELIPLREPQSLRGFIKGIDTEVRREEDRVRTWWIPAAGWSTLPMARWQISMPRPWKTRGLS